MPIATNRLASSAAGLALWLACFAAGFVAADRSAVAAVNQEWNLFYEDPLNITLKV